MRLNCPQVVSNSKGISPAYSIILGNTEVKRFSKTLFFSPNVVPVVLRSSEHVDACSAVNISDQICSLSKWVYVNFTRSLGVFGWSLVPLYILNTGTDKT